jgi:hypothetical protein
MAERISVKRAAELTGLSQLTIREGIKSGRLEFGRAIPSKSGKHHTIHISPKKLEEYLGIQELSKKELDPLSAVDVKIELLEEQVHRLKNETLELNVMINALLDNQEYIIKKLRGEKPTDNQTLYASAIIAFRKKPVYVPVEEKVTVKRAAELTGLSELSVRFGIINGNLPIGTATQKRLYNGKYHTVYHVYAKKLANYLGITVEQVKGNQ